MMMPLYKLKVKTEKEMWLHFFEIARYVNGKKRGEKDGERGRKWEGNRGERAGKPERGRYNGMGLNGKERRENGKEGR